jgi:hypothetical protein
MCSSLKICQTFAVTIICSFVFSFLPSHFGFFHTNNNSLPHAYLFLILFHPSRLSHNPIGDSGLIPLCRSLPNCLNLRELMYASLIATYQNTTIHLLPFSFTHHFSSFFTTTFHFPASPIALLQQQEQRISLQFSKQTHPFKF